METGPGEQHRHAGCWDESLGVFRQVSSSRICLESLKEEGEAGVYSSNSDGEPVDVLVTSKAMRVLSQLCSCVHRLRFL